MRMDMAAAQPPSHHAGTWVFTIDRPITSEIILQQLRPNDYKVFILLVLSYIFRWKRIQRAAWDNMMSYVYAYLQYSFDGNAHNITGKENGMRARCYKESASTNVFDVHFCSDLSKHNAYCQAVTWWTLIEGPAISFSSFSLVGLIYNLFIRLIKGFILSLFYLFHIQLIILHLNSGHMRDWWNK